MLAGQNTPDLMTTAVNLNGATIKDGAGNAANLSLSGITQGSPQIDTTVPTATGDLGRYRELITGDAHLAPRKPTAASDGI